mmetsp:Transcript_8624/g.20372  ORF Transcript_8624/g.20372 Transcript_8624/m.20372 type:complete len:249 (+) Transcript_8624:1310-2056(+)
MNMPSVRSPGPFLYFTFSKILRPAPPHLAFSASCFVTSSALTSMETNLTTALSSGSTPVVCIAFVSHSGPISLSILGEKGNLMPQYSPGSSKTTAALNSAIFFGRPSGPSPTLGKTSQTSGGMGCHGSFAFSCSGILGGCAGCSGSSGSGAEASSAVLSLLTNSSLPGSLILTHPSAGPPPDTSLYFSRSPLSSSSSTSEPVERRSGSCGEPTLWPDRTRIPPLSAPPTTSHSCGILPSCRAAPGKQA